MEELLKAINVAPVWALYATLGTAALKSAIAVITAADSIKNSAKARRALSAISVLSSYLLAISAFSLFITLRADQDLTIGIFGLLLLLITLALLLFFRSYAKKHPDPTPRAPAAAATRKKTKNCPATSPHAHTTPMPHAPCTTPQALRGNGERPTLNSYRAALL